MNTLEHIDSVQARFPEFDFSLLRTMVSSVLGGQSYIDAAQTAFDTLPADLESSDGPQFDVLKETLVDNVAANSVSTEKFLGDVDFLLESYDHAGASQVVNGALFDIRNLGVADGTPGTRGGLDVLRPNILIDYGIASSGTVLIHNTTPTDLSNESISHAFWDLDQDGIPERDVKRPHTIRYNPDNAPTSLLLSEDPGGAASLVRDAMKMAGVVAHEIGHVWQSYFLPEATASQTATGDELATLKAGIERHADFAFRTPFLIESGLPAEVDYYSDQFSLSTSSTFSYKDGLQSTREFSARGFHAGARAQAQGEAVPPLEELGDYLVLIEPKFSTETK